MDYLVTQQTKIVIIGHIGRDPEDSLQPISDYLQKKYPHQFLPNFFANADIDQAARIAQKEIAASEPGSIFILDNLRQHSGEKENSTNLAEKLAPLCDYFVQDAFSVAHRAHMSMDALPRQYKTGRKFAGINFENEITGLGSLEASSDSWWNRDSLAIIGGNKFATKLPLIKKLLAEYDRVLVGGALANTLYKMRGDEIGQSVHDTDLDEQTTKDLHEIIAHKNLVLPEIVVVEKPDGSRESKNVTEVLPDEKIYDLDHRSFSGRNILKNKASIL